MLPRDLHHEVRLDMGIIFMYNISIWRGSWGSGCCRRPRRRRRRRRSERSGTFTMKSGLACRLIWYITCPRRSSGFNRFQQVPPGQFKTFSSGGKNRELNKKSPLVNGDSKEGFQATQRYNSALCVVEQSFSLKSLAFRIAIPPNSWWTISAN